MGFLDEQRDNQYTKATRLYNTNTMKETNTHKCPSAQPTRLERRTQQQHPSINRTLLKSQKSIERRIQPSYKLGSRWNIREKPEKFNAIANNSTSKQETMS